MLGISIYLRFKKDLNWKELKNEKILLWNG